MGSSLTHSLVLLQLIASFCFSPSIFFNGRTNYRDEIIYNFSFDVNSTSRGGEGGFFVYHDEGRKQKVII